MPLPVASIAAALLALNVQSGPATRGPAAGPAPFGALRAASPQMALKLEMSPEEAAALLEDGPAASQGPFGKGGALEGVANALDGLAEVTLGVLHAFDDKEVQDSSKNLQVLWSRAVLAKVGELDDPVAYNMLPKTTRDTVTVGIFDKTANFLEWVAARTKFLNEGTDAFLSSPSCADGKPCQIVVFGAGFDTRSIRYQREGLRFFEVDLPDTIEAKRVVQERYAAENPGTILPTRVGFDLNDCEQVSLLDKLEAEHGLRRDVPTMFISEAVMFYVNPRAIANLYGEIFDFGKTAEAMYSFTDSMRPLVQGPFSDEITRFLDAQDVEILSHSARWSGAVQFMHAVARTPELCDADASLLRHVAPRVDAPINSYAPERARGADPKARPSFNDQWYALAYSSEVAEGTPYSTRLFGEPLTITRHAAPAGADGAGEVTIHATHDGLEYACAEHQDLIWLWRGAKGTADAEKLPTHPTPEATHAVETILDYGVDWSYIVENNLDTPHLYWLHDGSIPPIEGLGCNRANVGKIGLRMFTDDVGVGHIGKTATKTTKVVRFDAPNIVRHGGVSGFSEEFNIIPLGPHRTRVLLRQRFPKGPILTTLLKLPGTRALLQYLVRNWNYQIGLEDYCVMQGQASNIDDLGAPNWKRLNVGDDLIVHFWKWKRQALALDGEATQGEALASEYYTRYDGSALDVEAMRAIEPKKLARPTHGFGTLADETDVRSDYLTNGPIADYPPINYKPYPLLYGEEGILDLHRRALDLRVEFRKLYKKVDRALPAFYGGATGLLIGGAATVWLQDAIAAVPMQ